MLLHVYIIRNVFDDKTPRFYVLYRYSKQDQYRRYRL